jgi:hypothetical protein
MIGYVDGVLGGFWFSFTDIVFAVDEAIDIVCALLAAGWLERLAGLRRCGEFLVWISSACVWMLAF